jgi:predicted CXXCH cytochrome family protein
MREGCIACHNPHGTVNQKMLVQRDANLCLKCHLEHPATIGDGTVMAGAINSEDHAAFSGGVANSSRLNRGTCWSSGCHEGVHGSNINYHFRP